MASASLSNTTSPEKQELTSFQTAEQLSTRMDAARCVSSVTFLNFSFFFFFFFFLFRTHGRLDLTGLSLKNLPVDMFSMIVTISLTLDSNDLKDLDGGIAHLILLQELSARCNRLERIPSVVFDLPALTRLDLSFNDMKSVAPGPFRQLKALRELNLSNNSLVSLPEEIAFLVSLETLNVEGNVIKHLPELSQMKNLTALIAYDNKLQSAPRSLPASLETVDFSRNDLTSLNNSNVCSIASLRTLDLSSNRLAELPRFRCPNLEELAIADNRLESLCSLEDLPHLRVLDASRNQLRSLPFSIGALSQLAEVHLRNNCLEFLPQSLGMCQRLRMLDVSDNKLETIPEELASIPTLTHLKFRHNSLNWVPTKLSELPHLQELDLVNNRRIANLPPEMTREETPAKAVLRYLSTLLPQQAVVAVPAVTILQEQQQHQHQQQFVAVTDTPQSSYKTPRLRKADEVEEEVEIAIVHATEPKLVPAVLPSAASSSSFWTVPEWLLPAAAGAGAMMLFTLWLTRVNNRRK